MSNILQAIWIVALVTLTPMIAIFLYTYTRRSNMNIEKAKIELEIFRKSYENSIYQINEKLTGNSERWNDVNHLLIEAAKRSINANLNKDENAFLKSMSIDRDKISQKIDCAFLITPLNNNFSNQSAIIKNACMEVGIACKTADEKFINGPILSFIVESILSARIVIALIDGRNPNVYYELGLAHAFGKIVVMVSSGAEKVSFDIGSQRIVMVDWNSPNTKRIIGKAITDALVFGNDHKYFA